MALIEEIQKARKDIITDGYQMSIGEIINLYRDGDIWISPEFQRLFRWGISRKTRFIESLLLGIPTPPIFVFQNDEGIWELIDGLQRLSTILEFVGELKKDDPEPSILEGTTFLPSLSGKMWNPSNDDTDDGIGILLQRQIKRTRIRVEIITKESDPQAKYELFQRLNTGGVELSEQEVRNCVAVMLDNTYYKWLKTCAEDTNFLTTISQTDHALSRQMHMELALRFFAFRNVEYTHRIDVHEYLDNANYLLATKEDFDKNNEGTVFNRTFKLLNASLGACAFKRWDGNQYSGMFLMSLFEVIAKGVSENLEFIENLTEETRTEFLHNKSKSLWTNEVFQKNSGAGVRGTTRLANLLPMAKSHFAQ